MGDDKDTDAPREPEQRTGDAARVLGAGAAMGLGAAAAAGLVLAGRADKGHGATAHPAGGHPTGASPSAGNPVGGHPSSGASGLPPASPGDQGYTPAAATDPTTASVSTPVDAPSVSAPAVAGTAPAVAGTAPAVAGTTPAVAGTTPAVPAAGPAYGTVPGHVARPTISADSTGGRWRTGGDGPYASAPYAPAPYGPGTAAGDTRRQAAPVLYDSAGRPIGTVDHSGRFEPFRNGAATDGRTSESADATMSPVLYDSSGHPIALLDDSGHVVPISAAQTPATFGVTDPQSTTSAPQTEEQTPVPYTDEEVNDILLSETPEQRRQEIENALRGALDDPKISDEQRAAIHSVLNSGNIPDLPDDFYSHDYTYTPKGVDGNPLTGEDGNPLQPKNMNSLSAAATIALLNDQYARLKIDIGVLSKASDELELKIPGITTPANKLSTSFESALAKFDWIIDKWGDPEGSIAKAKNSFVQIKAAMFGGTYTDFNCVAHADGNVSATTKTIENFSVSLGEAASKYVMMENANLSQFGLSADGFDPRSKRDKDRYVDGEDKSREHPPGYFDTTDPASPYYKQV